MAGHFGVSKTLNFYLRKYFLLQLCRLVENYTHSCIVLPIGEPLTLIMSITSTLTKYEQSDHGNL